MLYIKVVNDYDIVGFGKNDFGNGIEYNEYGTEYTYTSYLISNYPEENGEPVLKKYCYWDGSIVQKKTDTEIINEYKVMIWKYLVQQMKDNLFDIIVYKRENGSPAFDFDDLITQAVNFKANNSSLSTFEDIDNARDVALAWLGLIT